MDLRCFVAAAEESSVARAAERLAISQPRTSKHLIGLEHAFGVELFSREARGATLTASGAALLPHAREVLAAWDRAQRAIQDSKGG